MTINIGTNNKLTIHSKFLPELVTRDVDNEIDTVADLFNQYIFLLQNLYVVVTSQKAARGMHLFSLVSILFVCFLLVILNIWLNWHVSEIHSSHRDLIFELNKTFSRDIVPTRAHTKQGDSFPDNLPRLKDHGQLRPIDPQNIKVPPVKRSSPPHHTVNKKMSSKRAIIFTMDSISSCECTIQYVITLTNTCYRTTQMSSTVEKAGLQVRLCGHNSLALIVHTYYLRRAPDSILATISLQ